MTLDEEVAARLRRLARERGLSFKEAINAVLREGLGREAGRARRYRVPAAAMGLRPGIDLDKALAFASALEDEEILRKLELRK